MVAALRHRQTGDRQAAGSQLQQLEELHPRPLLIAKGAEHGAGDRVGVLLLDTPHRHTEMCPLAHHRDTERLDLLENGVRNLVGQAFLQLQTPRENVDQPRNLAEADHLAIWNVRDMTLAEEWQQVMLAHAVEVDVADDYHLAIIDA